MMHHINGILPSPFVSHTRPKAPQVLWMTHFAQLLFVASLARQQVSLKYRASFAKTIAFTQETPVVIIVKVSKRQNTAGRSNAASKLQRLPNDSVFKKVVRMSQVDSFLILAALHTRKGIQIYVFNAFWIHKVVESLYHAILYTTRCTNVINKL